MLIIWFVCLLALSVLHVQHNWTRHEAPVDAAEEGEDGQDDADDGDDQGAGAQVTWTLLVTQRPHDPRGWPNG